MTVGSLFAGIGGFDLGLERAGFEIKWQVEIDPFCRAVLAKHWPHVKRYEDVRTVGSELEHVDVICGGFPCQDISDAGKRIGINGPRSGLWSEFARLVGELRPRFVIVENVAGLLSLGMGRVLGDLATFGYDAEWDTLPAVAFGTPHRRDRVWIVAYPGGVEFSRWRRTQGSLFPRQWSPARSVQFRHRREYWTGEDGPLIPDANSRGCEVSTELDRAQVRAAAYWGSRWRHADGCDCATQWCVDPDVGRVAHGVPARVDRLRGLGNAIVPQIAQWIAERIKEAEARA